MGIIQKQSIQGTIYSYLGVLIGFANTVLFYPVILDNDQIGLLKILVSYSVLFAQFGGLGMPSVITRYFPWFRNAENRHNGFFYISTVVSLAGFLLCLLLFFILKPLIIADSQSNSALLIEYLWYLIPLIFFTLFYNMFDAYSKVLYDAVIGTSLREFYQRIFITAAIGLFFLDWLTFPQFVLAYVVALNLPTLILGWVLWKRQALSLKSVPGFADRKMQREMLSVGAFSVLSGFTILIILNIDSIMINSILGLDATGVYSTVFFFGTLVIIPSRALIKISSTVIADAWKNNQPDIISSIYSKSCLTQAIIGMLIFIGIWANADNIFRILPAGRGFEEGRYVVLFIGLANLFEMMTGVNNNIVSTSKYYRVHTYFMIVLVGLVILTNLFFIPRFGIMGAALASAISVLIYSLLRMGFVAWKFGMQPYNHQLFKVIAISGLAYLAGWALPVMESLYLDIAVRSSLMSLVYMVLIYLFRPSEEINERIRHYLGIIGLKINH